MNPTKISPIAFFIPNLSGGGAQRVVVNIVNGLVERVDRPIHLLVGCQGSQLLEEIDPRVVVIRLHRRKVSHCVVPIVQYLRRFRPVAICSSLNYANIICLMSWLIAGRQSRMLIRDDGVLRSPAGLDLAFRFRITLMKILYPLADYSISVSRGVLNSLTTNGIRAGVSSRVIYNPLHVNKPLDRSPVKNKTGWKLPSRYICAVGRLTPVKGFDRLLEAFSLLADQRVALVIVGEGPESVNLKKQAVRLNIADRVLFSGWLDEPQCVISRSIMVVVPSRSEGFGNVVVEALAHDVPIVAFDCPGGISEILEGGLYGRLVPNGDTIELSRAIDQALLGSSECVGDRIKRSLDFSVENILPKYIEIILK